MFIALMCATCIQAAYAGSIPAVAVSGTVTDDLGAPLPGVSILEKGTVNGTVTDASGKFSLTVNSEESILVFSFVGFVPQQIVVGSQSVVNVQLVGDPTTLSEVVVVGYGTQEAKDVTGAVSSLKSESFNKGVINSPEQLLQGKIAGVNVVSASGEPGTTQSITVRGPGGIRTGSTPLFVVDGLALDNSGTGGVGVNPLNFINPQDIASIDVLKDASATAIYGSRGANGVILITTKKGKAGVSSISYAFDYGISKMARKIDVFSADEYRQRVPEAGGVLEDSLASTDWQDEITRVAYTKNHNVNFSGGSEKFAYYASLGMQDQEGVLKNSELKRYTGRLNVSQKFLSDDRIAVDLNLNATQTTAQRPSIEGVIGTALSANPTYPAYDENGDPYRYPSGMNPLLSLELNKDIVTTNRVIGNISPSIKLIKGLEYKLNFGIDYASSTRDNRMKANTLPPQDGRLESTFGVNSNSLIENYLTYTAIKNRHAFSALVGHSYQKFFIQSRTFSVNKFPVSELDPINIPGSGQDLTLANNRPTGYATRNELQSFFGRANYEFNNRYLLTATVRVDGSSKFGENNQYGTFPSFSLGWRISEEEFMSSIPVSNLKLRLGWGQTGNQEIPSKITRQLFISTVTGSTSYPLSNAQPGPAGTVFSRLRNEDIQWEVSTQTNIGIDFAFLRGALSGSVDVFNKVSNNILLETNSFDPQPSDKYWMNVEDMEISNKGLEIALNYDYVATSGFGFSIGGNTTFIKNEISNSPFSIIASGNATGSGLTSATINGYVNGEPIGTFYLKEFLGVGENGKSIFNDRDSDGYITDRDRIAAGSALPKVMYAFNATVRYKGFDLTANFNGVSGNKIYDNTENAFFYKAKISKGVNTTDAAFEYPQESANNAADVSTRFLKDGSFLRLNNLALGYNLNPSAIKLDNWIKSIRFSVTGQNLFVITDYDGYDPEVNIDRTVSGVTSYGIDYLSYPKARTIILGLNVSF
ncbi:SusC/RagA family TonB-linked outer membrane protein [Pseudochryseolinea flava]|uniref:SusC/RagA family TonB-linked outer membrane protein n=2 Tax=Pseudochryseolinea flava TaxID=2059302 RepID=A0A364Y095_9BACT|nr:SusC/RagA family TonB-linked outer membrane protein [Pseudochryseolinea flava]